MNSPVSNPQPAKSSVHAGSVQTGRSVFIAAILATVCLALLGPSPALAADVAKEVAMPDLAKGEQIAAGVCVACHGTDGNSALPVNPKLAGQHFEYLYKQLKNFKPDGDKPAQRANAVMAGFAGQLSDEDMRAVAAYYSGQQLKPEAAKDKELAEMGRDLYRGGDAARGLPSCAGCHGPAGAGIPGQYPGLAGQHAEYTASQLTGFRQGTRMNSTQMTTISAKLSDKEIAALADYIAGLR